MQSAKVFGAVSAGRLPQIRLCQSFHDGHSALFGQNLFGLSSKTFGVAFNKPTALRHLSSTAKMSECYKCHQPGHLLENVQMMPLAVLVVTAALPDLLTDLMAVLVVTAALPNLLMDLMAVLEALMAAAAVAFMVAIVVEEDLLVTIVVSPVILLVNAQNLASLEMIHVSAIAVTRLDISVGIARRVSSVIMKKGSTEEVCQREFCAYPAQKSHMFIVKIPRL